MKKLHLPDNLKIHFAGIESESYFNIINSMGINYVLYSAYPYIMKKLFGKDTSKLDVEKIKKITNNTLHVIQDSGLFSLLFGSKSYLADKSTIYKWYDALVEWTLEHNENISCVEIDAQSIIGVNETWNLREKIKKDLPNNRIINVFHLEDGLKGLDRMIEYSDYIALGAPELKKHNKLKFLPTLVRYIKNKKKDIDIHILGCTNLNILKQCDFCTSADSTTWFRALRFGDLDSRYFTRDLDSFKIKKMTGDAVYEQVLCNNNYNEINANAMCASIEMYKRLYQINIGNQNYKYIF